jgi:arginine:ornithine antiporter/lysine permease
VLYAPGTVLYIWARREQGKQIFKPIDWVILMVVVIGALVGLFGLATGAITI